MMHAITLWTVIEVKYSPYYYTAKDYISNLIMTNSTEYSVTTYNDFNIETINDLGHSIRQSVKTIITNYWRPFVCGFIS